MNQPYDRLNSTSPPRRNPIDKSITISPHHSEYVVNKQQKPHLILANDWFEQIDLKKNIKQSEVKIRKLFEFIKKSSYGYVGVTISFDAFGILKQKQYSESNVNHSLEQVLKQFRHMNYGKTLEEIRVQQEIDKRNKNNHNQNQQDKGSHIHRFTKLRIFKFSFIGWKNFSPGKFISIIQKTVFTDRIVINLQKTIIDQMSLDSICQILLNQDAQYDQIQINLSNCPNANYTFMEELLKAQMVIPTKVLKLRFVGWGKSYQQYFKGNRPSEFQRLLQNTRKSISELRSRLAKSSIQQITLDFREWHADFKLKEVEVQNNEQLNNANSFGLFSKTKNNKRIRNIKFMA